MKKALLFPMILSAALTVAGCSCGGGGSDKGAGTSVRKFRHVEVPAMLSGSGQRAEYVCDHYWDVLLAPPEGPVKCDSSFVAGFPAATIEQEMSNFSSALQMLEPAAYRPVTARLYRKLRACEIRDTSSNVYESVCALMEKYFYDPSSPLRNEDVYWFFAREMAADTCLDETRRTVAAHAASMCALNPVGEPAADFVFQDRAGRRYTLHGLKARWTVLFFSNPGCHACKDIIEALKASEKLTSLIADGTVVVANVYIDEDLKEWYGYMEHYPTTWYNGFDPNYVIRNDLLYNLRAIPSLYLLDGDKRVIMKDAETPAVLSFIDSL